MKESLQITDPLFQKIIDALPVLLFWTDSQHNIKGSNQLHTTTFGFSTVEECLNLSMAEWGKRANLDQKTIDALYLTHNEIMHSKHGQVIEYKGLVPNNPETVYLSYKEPLLDEQGNVVGLVGISTDITANKKHEQALAKAKLSADHIFQNIIDALPVLLFWTDKNHTMMGQNLRHARSFGTEAIGKSMQEFCAIAGMDDKLIKRLYKEHNEIITSKTGKVFEYTFNLFDENKNKKITSVLSPKEPLLDEHGEVIGVIGITMDITELKNTQKALKKSKEKAEASSAAKSEFISNMSHDIRTPITGVIGMVQDLLNTAENIKLQLTEAKPGTVSSEELVDKLYELIDAVEEDGDILMGSADQLLQLCNEILESMRLDSGKATITSESFDLHQLLAHNIELLQPVAQHRQLALSMDIDSSVPQYVDGLRTYLDRALLNLISNALKFTKEGFIKVSVTASSKKQNKPYKIGDVVLLKIVIEDTGVGIPEDKFEIIFEHFSRLTPSYEGNYKGSGLGLYTVKRYVEAMKGHIDLQSEIGKGSTFTLSLPFEVSDYSHRVQQSIRMPTELKQRRAAARSNKKPSITATLSTGSNSSILIVEDNLAARIGIQAILKQFDCSIDFAETGAMAVEKAASVNYDLILMDIGLPDFNGMEATRQIRALADQKKSQVPIVALTGHIGENSRQECMKIGMQDLLNKPAQPLALESVFERFVWKNAVENTAVNNAAEKSADVKKSSEDKLPADIIDWNACVRMMNGDVKFVKNMLLMMVKELKTTQVRLAEGMQKNDMTMLREELHRCLGGVVYLRLPQLEKSLRDFHAAVKAEYQDSQHVKNIYEDLQSAMHAFWTVCEQTDFENIMS